MSPSGRAIGCAAVIELAAEIARSGHCATTTARA